MRTGFTQPSNFVNSGTVRSLFGKRERYDHFIAKRWMIIQIILTEYLYAERNAFCRPRPQPCSIRNNIGSCLHVSSNDVIQHFYYMTSRSFKQKPSSVAIGQFLCDDIIQPLRLITYPATMETECTRCHQCYRAEQDLVIYMIYTSVLGQISFNLLNLLDKPVEIQRLFIQTFFLANTQHAGKW